MEIRSYQANDKDKVIHLLKTVFPDDPPHNEPSKVIDAKMGIQRELFFIAELDEHIVGTVMAG